MKSNTAIIIVLVFFFRLLFVNVYLFASTGAASGGNHKKTHYSTNFKRRRDTKVAASLNMREFAAAEICEENTDGEEKIKTSSPFLLSFLSSFFNTQAQTPEWADTFDSIKCNLYPKKYLSLSTLRI